MSKLTRSLSLAALLMAAACASAPEATNVRSYTGTYFSNFENTAFLPDPNQPGVVKGEDWWAEFSPDAWAKISALGGEAAKPASSHTLYVRAKLSGTLSLPGRYGGLSAYERVFRVSDVEEATLITSAEFVAALGRFTSGN